MKVAMLNDVTKCIGCRGCQTGCKQWNSLPAQPTEFTGSYENPPSLSPITWTRIMFREVEGRGGDYRFLMTKEQCMHCTEAGCVKVCPTGAMHHTPEGTVRVDPNRCVACNYCVAHCPFNVPKFDQVRNKVRKCTFCYDRITHGMTTSCTHTCPTGSIQMGERQKIARMAQERVAELKAQGKSKARVYGLEECGGLGVIYVLEDRPSAYGLPEDPEVSLVADVWGAVFQPVRMLAVAGAVGVGLLAARQKSDKTRNKE